MRICHISWEYPPVVYGGLGRHVHAVAREQAAAGHDVVVISHVGIGADQEPARDEHREGVRVLRVVRDAPHVPFSVDTLMGWVAGLTSAMTSTTLNLVKTWQPDVVHAHDWLTAHAASVTSQALTTPWVHTVHATEAGRHQGWLPSPLSAAIHETESWAAHHADQTLVCSQHMQWEVEKLFGLPGALVIPNGVDEKTRTQDPANSRRIRDTYGQCVLVHAGRLEWEKGTHTLIDALPQIRRSFPHVQCVIAGRGSQEEHIREQARRKRVARRVHVRGWLPADDVRTLVAAADVMVIPSLYEPFGMVALEAASVGTPVVAAKSGGLNEFLDNEQHGFGFTPGNPKSLADAVTTCLHDPPEAERRAQRAREFVTQHRDWTAIAARLVGVYDATRQRPRARARDTATTQPPASTAPHDPGRNLLFEIEDPQ